jgi:hypothetical protein
LTTPSDFRKPIVTPTEKRRFIELCQLIAVERDGDTYHRLCMELEALLKIKSERLHNERHAEHNPASAKPNVPGESIVTKR